VDIGSPSTPGSDKILATMNVTPEDVDVGLWVGPWDADERYKSIPRSDATIEMVMLPGLAVMGEGLGECGQHRVRGSKSVEQTSPVMTIS